VYKEDRTQNITTQEEHATRSPCQIVFYKL